MRCKEQGAQPRNSAHYATSLKQSKGGRTPSLAGRPLLCFLTACGKCNALAVVCAHLHRKLSYAQACQSHSKCCVSFIISSPFVRQLSTASVQRQKVKTMFQHIPNNAVIAHYAEVKPGIFAVVTPTGKTLAPSFYALRKQYSFFMSINGAGGWVVMLPKPAPVQASLF